MDPLIQALSNAGLNEKEAKIYISLLQIGRGSAYAISERSGLKKPTTYVILQELIKKGLVLRIPKVKKQMFIAKSPDEFFALAEERLKLARQRLPELITMAESNSVKVRTLFYEGLKGIEDAMYYRVKEMKSKEIFGFFATTEEASPELIDIFLSWPEKMSKSGVKINVITPKHKSVEGFMNYDKLYGHIIKTIPYDLYSAKSSIEAGDTFVRVVLFKPLQAVIIESPELATSLRQIFNIVWNKI